MSFKSTLHKKVSGTGKQTGNLFSQCNGFLTGVLDNKEEFDTSVVVSSKEINTCFHTRVLEKNHYENLIIGFRLKTDYWRPTFPQKSWHCPFSFFSFTRVAMTFKGA